nr:hypothetical protein [Tanacetum cinerariifolium]
MNSNYELEFEQFLIKFGKWCLFLLGNDVEVMGSHVVMEMGKKMAGKGVGKMLPVEPPLAPNFPKLDNNYLDVVDYDEEDNPKEDLKMELDEEEEDPEIDLDEEEEDLEMELDEEEEDPEIDLDEEEEDLEMELNEKEKDPKMDVNDEEE